MRVGAFVAGYTPDAGGGYTFETDILDGLIDLADETPHEFKVLSPPDSVHSLQRRLAGSNLTAHSLRTGPFDRLKTAMLRKMPMLRAHWRRKSALDRVAREAGVDLIWFLGAGAHLTDLPYITVVWDLQHRATPWFPEMSASGMWDSRELANDWFLRRATAVVTGTQAGREELERFYQLQPESIRILPHPTPRFAMQKQAPREAAARVLRRLGIRGDYLLYPAQFWPHKNHVNLLHAVELLRSRHGLDFELALVGSDKGSRQHVESVARKLGIASEVHFLGFVAREDLVALYQSAVALTYVSWCGPENLPPLEAFALDCPVVATRIPGAEEQMGSAALLVDPSNPEDIANGIANVYRDQELRSKLISAGSARARKWTARDYVRGVFSILDEFEPVVRCWRPA